MDKLKELRKSIQDIDYELLRLLADRVDIAKQIGNIKKESGDPIYVPEVEKQKIEALLWKVFIPDWLKPSGL